MDAAANLSSARPLTIWSRRTYSGLAWALVALVIAQVFFAGLALFDNAERWSWHVNLGRFLQYLPLLLVVLAFSGRLPVRLRWLTGALTVLLFVQGILIYLDEPLGTNLVTALHPVNALAIFWLALTLARQSTNLLKGG